MARSFDDVDGLFLVVVNAEGRHSLWPAARAVPAGWTVVDGPGDRSSCLDHIKASWTDMRPLNLVAHLDGHSTSEPEREAVR